MKTEKVGLNMTIREYYTGDIFGQGEVEKVTVDKDVNGRYVLTAEIPEEMAMELARYQTDLRYFAEREKARLNYEATQRREFAPFPFKKVDFDFTTLIFPEDDENEEDDWFDDEDNELPF